MNEKVLKCLFDIKIAIEEIDSFFETESRDFDNYKKNFHLCPNCKLPEIDQKIVQTQKPKGA